MMVLVIMQAVCSELMQLNRHLLSEVMKSHESQLGLSGYKAKVAANMSSQETIRHEVLVLAEMLQVAEKAAGRFWGAKRAMSVSHAEKN